MSQLDSVNPIIRIAVDRRVTMAMLVLGVIVMGILSLLRLPLEFLPSFESSNISVRVPYDSSSPDEVARLIVQPLEDSLSTINGIKTLRASASASGAGIDLEFIEGTSMELASVEVRDRLDRARHLLPDDLERMYIRRFQSTDIPILRLNLSAKWPRADLFEFVEDVVQRRLERLDGVANVDIWGLQTRQLSINLNPARMAAHGIGIRELVTQLQTNNVTLSGGYIREGSRKLLVRSMGELDRVEALRQLPVNAAGLSLGDLGTIDYEFPRQEDFNYLNGSESVGLAINKASNANLLRVIEGVKEEFEAIKLMPEAEGLDVQIFHDSSQDVLKGLSELRNTGILGGVLAVVFMLAFLRRFRMTLLVAFAIPMSLILTFVLMYLYRIAGFGDISINIMSLMGLMLAVGMLVDNSIVVIESVVRHRQEFGEDPRTAALLGASEVAMPIVCSTLTTICVFVPMIFMSESMGRMGMMMSNMGLTVVIVMISSLLVSLTVVPTMAAILLRGKAERDHRIFDKFKDLYGWILAFTLRHRFAFTIVAIGMLWGSYVLYVGIERSFETPSYDRQLGISVEVPNHYSEEERTALFEELYGLFDSRREELEIANISYRYRTAGGRSRDANRIDLFLTSEEQASRSTLQIRDAVFELLPVRPGVNLSLARSMKGPPGSGGGIRIEVSGEDTQILEIIAERVMAELRQMPMVKDVDSSLESGDEEIVVSVNRERALQAGLTSQAVARAVGNALSSRPVSYIKSEEREVGLVVQYREEDRETLAQLRNLSVGTGGAALPIGSLAEFSTQAGPRSIERENRRSKLTIDVETAGNVPSFALMGPLGGVVDSIGMPPGYQWSFGKNFFDAENDMQQAVFAFIFALVLIYMIMASLFENFLQPFTILVSVPFAFIGVGLVLWLAGQPRGSSEQMGLIILAGIVVNNAIVLIDHINQLRRQGLSRSDAIVQGGRNRLRPIIMTAITTILGLSPMVAPFFFPDYFGAIEGRAAMWAPIGLVILGGLTTSTFLTLMIIPTIYSLVDDFAIFCRKLAAAI